MNEDPRSPALRAIDDEIARAKNEREDAWLRFKMLDESHSRLVSARDRIDLSEDRARKASEANSGK